MTICISTKYLTKTQKSRVWALWKTTKIVCRVAFWMKHFTCHFHIFLYMKNVYVVNGFERVWGTTKVQVLLNNIPLSLLLYQFIIVVKYTSMSWLVIPWLINLWPTKKQVLTSSSIYRDIEKMKTWTLLSDIF